MGEFCIHRGSAWGEGGVYIQKEGSASRLSASGGRGVHPGGGSIWRDGQTDPHRILRGTVNERTVGILLECILVS